jgi:hypothetical protein
VILGVVHTAILALSVLLILWKQVSHRDKSERRRVCKGATAPEEYKLS